ncbi:cytosolic endo-beta-N-acetylglucosaminidase 1-like isoform X2 [Macadamia integrifolia]|uniref:cytosolic endo-beta-N-acetylglucosaminidase 1-like isoform X2 n=1 Tax=Macadamia integrifolia TaxID=60698 RepID=UPI001C4FCC49|nr:cytosolic endo-beta-N-acetylglucosaminidase 1-like isoform X2 [Macadamia integrifolia]
MKRLLIRVLRYLLSFFRRMNSSSSIDANTPAFDPFKPSEPVSFPIRNLDDLEWRSKSRSYFDSFHFPFNKASVPLPSDSVSLPDRSRILVCHDMSGNYLDDKWIQGGSNAEGYAICHWYLMDIFVYFSHTLVTIPPPCWTNTAHTHGVKINVENRLDSWLIPNMKEFVGHLTRTMHTSVPGSLVIWYDSVTINGCLKWQDQLNEYNKPFFDICDGIFVNYTWKANYPKLSAAAAGERKSDVYMGIDVFGRNTYGGGQWNIKVALDLLKKDDVSAAIFAPGWVYETKQPPDFRTSQSRWWGLIEQSWGILQFYPKVLPFYSNFDQGHGYHFSVEGKQVGDDPWYNISCQSFQPVLDNGVDSTLNTLQVLVNFKDASYSGGGNITFKGTLEDTAYFTTRIFCGKLPLADLPVHFTYSVRSDGSSSLGLVLELVSVTNGKKSVLLACLGSSLENMNQFSSKFDKVVMTHVKSKTEAAPGWIIHEASIAMNGYTLTEIRVVCYKLKPGFNELRLQPDHKSGDQTANLVTSPSVYHASLGHISIRNYEQKDFPPSTCWEVKVQDILWASNSQGTRTVSIKIVWELKRGDSSVFAKYIMYVKKIAENEAVDATLGEIKDYLGVAHVQAFYVSDLVVPPGISSLKFFIQVCHVDGFCQQLDNSPNIIIGCQRYIEDFCRLELNPGRCTQSNY